MVDSARRRGQRAHGKGYRYQGHLATMLRQIFPAPQFEVREGHTQDIRVVDDDGEEVLAIEAKHRDRIDLWAALDQAVSAARPGTPAAAVCKRKLDEEAVVVIGVGDFLDLLRGWAPPVIA